MDLAEALIHGRAPLLDPNDSGTRVPVLYGFMGAFVPIAFLILSLRLYARWRFTNIGKDDVLVVVSFILYLGLVIATVYATKYGLGHHIWTVTEHAGVLMQKCGFSSQVLYPPALCAVKLSIVMFFIRCLPTVHDRKAPLYWFAGFILAEETAFTVALFLQCRPINFYWDKSVEGTCFDQQAFYYADAALNLATDLVILSLPWVLFRKLNVSRRQRYTVVAICSLGVFTLISSILRLPYLYDLNRSTDPTWGVVNIVMWSLAELGSAISLSSIPAIRPLYAHVFLKHKQQSSAASDSASNPPKKPTSNLGFGFKTIGSNVDKSGWRGQVQMFTLKSDNQDRSQLASQSTESQDHIVTEEEAKSQHVSASGSVDLSQAKENPTQQPATTKE